MKPPRPMHTPLLPSLLLLSLIACTEAVDDACPAPDPTLWSEREPSSYVFQTCGTGFAPRACTVTVVEEGRVVSTHDADDSDGFSPIEPSDAPTLSDAFGTPSCDECRIRFRLDGEWGYVESYYADCGEEGYGDDVTCFVADTLDPEACL